MLVFNGADGEWRARIGAGRQARAGWRCRRRRPRRRVPPDLWLLFAPVKKARTDFIVEKAVEMGVARLVPVQTEFTNSERIRQDRLQAHAREAAEQCGATWVPEVAALVRLDRVLAGWARRGAAGVLRRGAAGGAGRVRRRRWPATARWAILIGPEGGFSAQSGKLLRSSPFVSQFGLGPRILRADTAAIAAVALWQERFGDWR